MFEGMGDTEIPNVSEIRKEWSLREQQYQAQIEELQVAQYHPDYAEVVERFAAPLLKEKPSLLNAVLASQNKALTLYEIGKLAQQTKQLQEKVSASAGDSVGTSMIPVKSRGVRLAPARLPRRIQRSLGNVFTLPTAPSAIRPPGWAKLVFTPRWRVPNGYLDQNTV